MLEIYRNFKWGFDGEFQCMGVENGKVAFRGPEALHDVGHAESVDLGGLYLLPSFIDPHCHILPAGLDLQKLHLGDCRSHEALLEKVLERDRELDLGEWLLAVQYDQNRFADNEHISRRQLDQISVNRPILLRHSNGHASVANTGALVAAGIEDGTPNPAGGTYVKDAAGSLNGLLLERAHDHVSSKSPWPDLEQMADGILRAGELMASEGIATASDMMTGRHGLDQELHAYRLAAERGCKIRTRLYLNWSAVFGPKALPRPQLKELEATLDPHRCRIAGIKIFADGAIASGTASIYGRFVNSPKAADSYSDGQLIYEPERLKQMVRTAHEAGYRVAIHSIGDHATDLVMDAYSVLDQPQRHRIEHAMLLSDSQIERMQKLGIHCCMQPEFLRHFGGAYAKQLGQDRAFKLNRYHSVLEAGIPLSFSSDRPVVHGNPMSGIQAAVSRPEGFDPEENLTLSEAFYAYTAMGGVANGEPESNGYLLPGQYADYRLCETAPFGL